jgi:Protein of unknown function (DUF3485)
MTRIIPFIVGLGILVGSELFHGQWTDRWRLSNEPEASCAKLPKQNEAMIVGDWMGHPSAPLSDEDIVIGEIAGYFYQVFTHPRGHVVRVLVVCGRPGPIAVHTPEVCLGGEGFALANPKERLTVALPPPNKPAEFWVGQFFRYDSGIRKDRRQFWTYGTNGSWSAEENPRFSFARFPALYKIYIMRHMPRKDEKLEDDPTLEFIKVFMPEMQRRLFGSASAS